MAPVGYVQWNQMIQAFVICNLALFSKYFATLMYAADPDVHPKEDAVMLGERKEVDQEVKQRKTRTFANDLEKIPMNLIIFWAAFLVQNLANMSGNGSETTVALTVLMVVYTGVRFLFTICYIFAIQPVRTICFVFGNLCTIGAACLLVAAGFQTDTSKAFPNVVNM